MDVTYEPLETIIDPLLAMEEDAPLVHEALGSNIPFHRKFTFGDVDDDFAAAEVVVSDVLHWGRSGGQPLETVGAVADYDPGTGMMTIHVNSNSLTLTSYLFTLAATLKVPSNKLDMNPHPAGGSFGAKFWEVKTAAIAGMMSKVEMDPVEIRRKNFIQPDEFPYFIPTGNCYDSGNYEGVLEKVLELSDYHGWRRRQAEMRAEGRYVGIGICTCKERSVFSATEFWFWFDEPVASPVTSAPESVTLDIDAMGAVTATLYSNASWGNSPETMVAQFVGEELGIDPESVNVVYAGSNQGMPATGPGGSRFTIMVAGAVEGAAGRIKAKAAKIAAHLLEANEEDLEWVDSGFAVRGRTLACLKG